MKNNLTVNYRSKKRFSGKAITFIMLALLPVAVAATEWPAWQLVNNQGVLSFSNGDSVTLEHNIREVRSGGSWVTVPPTVPGYPDKTPPHIQIETPGGFPNNAMPDMLMFEVDLSNKTITQDTTVGFGDVPDFNLKLTLFDSNNNVLPLSGLHAQHFTIDYPLPSTVIADKDVVIDPDTGVLSLGPNEGSGTYNESGLSLFTNLPPETAKLTVTTTEESFYDHLQFYFGEGKLGAPVSGETNQPPTVAIVGGNRAISDSDEAVGETVSFEATATDSDGTVVTTEWLINDELVATGLTPNIALPDGVSEVVFRATDDDGDSSVTSVTVSVENFLPPLGDWPAYYEGVMPDETLGLGINNIGYWNPDDGLIYSCLTLLANGQPDPQAEVEHWGVAFELVFTEDIIFRLVNIRPFNQYGVLNENDELPDCSGEFEVTNLRYTDILQVGDLTLEIVAQLIVSDYLDFKLLEINVPTP